MNENLKLKKNIYHYYMDIDRQHKDDDFQLNTKRGSSIDAFDPLTHVGSRNMNPRTIHIGSNNP